MIDKRAHIRKLVARIIKLARETAGSSCQNDNKKYIIPKVNFETKDYYKLINWLNVPRLEPPISYKLADNNHDEATKTASVLYLEKFSCYTQQWRDMLKW